MKNVSDKSCREKQKKNFNLNNVFENRAIYETMWRKYCRAGQATYDNMAHAHCWTPRATKHTQVSLNATAFPLQHGYMNAPQCYFIRTFASLI